MDDVVCVALAVDLLRFAGGPLCRDQHFQVLGSDPKLCVHIRDLRCRNHNALGEGIESDIPDGHCVSAGGEAAYEKLPLSIR